MKNYINVLSAILFLIIVVSFPSCSKDDDGPNSGNKGENSFSFNDGTLYFHYENDYDWPTLNYSKRENISQLNFSLYQYPATFSGDNIDMYSIAGGGIELTPFNPSELKKGDELEIICSQVGRYSTYTCIEYDFKGWTSTEVIKKSCYMYVSGSITFEGYDDSSEVTSLKFNKVTLKGNKEDESCVLNGTMKCLYDEDGYLTLFSGDFY